MHDSRSGSARLRELRAGWRFSNISAVYVLIAVIILFAVWRPTLFPTYGTFTQIVNQNAITAMLALSILLPLASGVFDISVVYSFGLANVVVAKLLGSTNLSIEVIILVVIGIGIFIGLFNGFVVVVLNVDSLIGTLATGSILQALILVVSANQDLVNGISRSGFTRIAFASFHGITAPVGYAVVIAAIIWAFLQHTAYGRFTYASGLGPDAARLAGIRVERHRFGMLIMSGILGSLSGVVVTAVVGAGTSSIGPPYLIPVFAAAFLGATQLKRGLFNAWGTMLAVFLLGTVEAGLSLTAAPFWASYIFSGSVLIIAMAISGQHRRSWRPRRPVAVDEILPTSAVGGADAGSPAPGPGALASAPEQRRISP